MITTEHAAIADYRRFLEQKSQIGTRDGFEPLWLPNFLFDFKPH